MMDEEILMGRADFFKRIFHKALSTTSELVGDILEPISQIQDVAKIALTVSLIPIEEYHGEPKLLASSEPPIYIVGEIGKNLTAISAVCNKDGFLLTYLPQENVLYCSMCSVKHAIDIDDSYSVALPTYPLIIKEGYIYLINKSK